MESAIRRVKGRKSMGGKNMGVENMYGIKKMGGGNIGREKMGGEIWEENRWEGEENRWELRKEGGWDEMWQGRNRWRKQS